MTLTRDMAREAFKRTGVSLDAVSAADITDLRRHLTKTLKACPEIGGSLRLDGPTRIRKVGDGHFSTIRMKSRYFSNREAVSFNTDGFIGIAGWADNTNVQPVIAGFIAWTEELAAKKAMAAEPAHNPVEPQAASPEPF